jgi:Ca2+-binding RTX toxin-like protein
MAELPMASNLPIEPPPVGLEHSDDLTNLDRAMIREEPRSRGRSSTFGTGFGQFRDRTLVGHIRGTHFEGWPPLGAVPIYVETACGARRESTMRLRVLLSGLGFFVTALLLAWGPVVAHATRTQPRPACTIVGTAGNDGLLGTSHRDVICGLGGNDTIAGGSGNDLLRGGPGNDRIQGDAGNDRLMGGPGSDILFGYDGARDWLNGGPGRDQGYRDRTLDYIVNVESYPGL